MYFARLFGSSRHAYRMGAMALPIVPIVLASDRFLFRSTCDSEPLTKPKGPGATPTRPVATAVATAAVETAVEAAVEAVEAVEIVAPVAGKVITIDEEAVDDKDWEAEKEKCSFCKFFIESPCKTQFKHWSKCVDRAKTENVEFAEACSRYTQALMVCTSEHQEYFSSVPEGEGEEGGGEGEEGEGEEGEGEGVGEGEVESKGEVKGEGGEGVVVASLKKPAVEKSDAPIIPAEASSQAPENTQQS